MLSFHGSQELKDKYVARMKKHYDADEIIQGKFWEKGKGCFIGCLIEDVDPHARIESELGIPIMLSHLLDRIFELQSLPDAKEFTQRIQDVPIGVDLSRVSWKFLHWIVTECIPPNDITRQIAKVLEDPINGLEVDKKAAYEAYAAAASYAPYANAANAAAIAYDNAVAAAAIATAYAVTIAYAAAIATAAIIADAIVADAIVADAIAVAVAAAAYTAYPDAAIAADAVYAAYAAAKINFAKTMADKIIQLINETKK